jgi:hypothetical protein
MMVNHCNNIKIQITIYRSTQAIKHMKDHNIYMIMLSCPGNMPKYYPGLRDILPDHINIIIILSV